MPDFAAQISGVLGWRRRLTGILAGSLSALALAPVSAWPVMFFTLPVLVWLLDADAAARTGDTRRSPLIRAAKTGWCFGFGYFLAGLYWIGAAFFVEPDKFLWALPLAVMGVPAGLAIFYGTACGLAMLVWRPGGWRVLTLAVSFFAIEWVRGHIFTGFPWNSLGYSLAASDWLMQSASLVGAYGLTFIAVFIFASPAALFDAGRLVNRWAAPTLATVALVSMGVGGALRLSNATDDVAPGVKLRIVQGNIPQAEKWKPENRDWIFERYLRLSSENLPADVTHVIWPESSTPFLFAADEAIYDPAIAEAIKVAIPKGGSLVLGAERATTTTDANAQRIMTGVYNTLFVLSDEARIEARYDKMHLVPFGEYLPFPEFFRWLGAKHLTHHAIGFQAGALRAPIATKAAPPFSPLICYEIIFPGAVMPGVGAAGWMLNLTNDAWFGATSGPYQHLFQARVRAVEEGVPVVRAANTGISAVIDSYGRVIVQQSLNSSGIIDSALPVAISPPLYVWIRALGAMPLLLLMLTLYLMPLALAGGRKT